MVKIVIIEEQQLCLDMMKHLIDAYDDLELTASGSTGTDAVRLAGEHQPDVIVMGLDLKEIDGIEAMKQIKNANKQSKVLILASTFTHEQVDLAVSNGADGFLPRTVSRDELVLSIRSIAMGLKVIHDDVWERARKTAPKKVVKRGENKVVLIEDMKVELNQRELAIIEALVEDKGIPQIAKEHYLTEGRIRNIITEIIDKLMLKDRTQLVLYALRNDLVENYQIRSKKENIR